MKKPRPAPVEIRLLDSFGLALRQTPLPAVREYDSLLPFYEAGGVDPNFPPTEPAKL
jgi:hypothetical protein